MNIKINDIKFNTNPESKIKAFIIIETDNAIIKGFRVLETNNILTIGYPSYKGTDGKWYSHYYPKEFLKKQLEHVIIEEYKAQSMNRVNPDALKNLAKEIEKSLYSTEKSFKNRPIKNFQNGKIRAIDYFGFRFIQQNPMKTDINGELKSYAKLRKNGAKVTWIIQNNKYLGVVVDGQVKLK